MAALEVIIPDDAGGLWEALKKSGEVESALGVLSEPKSADDKYLKSLAETYQNAASWDTRRQVLSIMADLMPYSLLQLYIPGITEYRVKTARQHAVKYGRGLPVLVSKSPRMRVDYAQLDHFLDFITSPHNYDTRTNHGTVYSVLLGSQLHAVQQIYYAASVRKSLQGLDYIAADGGKAFDDLIEMLPKLRRDDRTWISRLQKVLKEAKQYIKGDYKVHVSSHSATPDHCSSYALSDPKDQHFCADCDQSHEESCTQCEVLRAAVKEVEDAITEAPLSEFERDDLQYMFHQALHAIESWTAHQLRSLQQDKARTTVLESLDETLVLITQNWTMKWLPQKYRETQADWFGKRVTAMLSACRLMGEATGIDVKRVDFSDPQGDVCKAEVSKGDFVPCSKERRVPAERAMTKHLDEEEDEDGDEEEEGASRGLLSCPVDGCICTYQKYYNLERHLLFGKCNLVSEKNTLFDQAVLEYAKKIQEGCSFQPTLAVPTTTDHEECPEAPLEQGWALKVPKKASRFNDNQRQYLDAKFQIGQETGHKSDPEKVSRDMRYARKENGQRLFQVDEFLTAQQIQGYFSRTAAKLKHATSQSAHVTDYNDLLAAQEEEAFSSARASILDQCQLVHPIVYDILNICSLYTSNKLTKLSVAQLRSICDFYNMEWTSRPNHQSEKRLTLVSFQILLGRVLARGFKT
ncbi:hypothetical protein ACROYT_G010483 [Oculina patagonica]